MSLSKTGVKENSIIAMKQIFKAIVVVLLFFCWQEAMAYVESTENVVVEVKKEKRLEVPDPSIGYVDYSKWTCDNSNLNIVSQGLGYAYVKAVKFFSGVANVECLYVVKWYDDRGYTQQSTFLQTFKISCKADASGDIVLTMNPQGGRVRRCSDVTFTLSDDKAKIYYTMDGSTPTENSKKIFVEGFYFEGSCIVKAIAISSDGRKSDVVTGEFTVFSDTFVSKEGIEVTYQPYGKDIEIGEGDRFFSTPCIDKNITGTLTIPPMIDGKKVVAINYSAFKNCNITKVILPEGMTVISSSAFNSNVEEIIIPSTLTRIGENGLLSLNLKKVFCKANNPPTLVGSVCVGIKRGCTLYVPNGTKSKYLSSNGWKDFYAIVETDSWPDEGSSDISDICDDADLLNANIEFLNGHFHVDGVDEIEIFNIQGYKVNNCSLTSGLYIIKFNGKIHKVYAR